MPGLGSSMSDVEFSVLIKLFDSLTIISNFGYLGN